MKIKWAKQQSSKKEKQVTTASKAKERLQIIVAHERNSRNKQPDYLPQLTEDILQVLRKYIKVSDESFSINLDKKDGNLNVLELNKNFYIIYTYF